MKKIIFLLISLLIKTTIYSTEQEPDVLIYQGKELSLSTGWGHPSPLETYYLQENIESPFKMLSTANYRGFVARWEIEQSKLYLNTITRKEKIYTAEELLGEISNNQQKIFANWFSGVIECTEDKGKDTIFYLFQFKEGALLSQETFTWEELIALTKKDVPNEIISKKYMYDLNHNYIAYYYRLFEFDEIVYKGTVERFSRKNKISPILQYYSDNHLLWPYGWENIDSGAPHCKWLISEDNKIYITNLILYSGLSFDGPDKREINLSTLFPNDIVNGMVFAGWLNGVYIITYGNNSTANGFTFFVPSSYIIFSVENGFIKNMVNLPGDYDFKNIDNISDKILKELLSKY